MYYLIGIFIFYIVFIVTGSRKQRMKIKIKKTITYKNVNIVSESNKGINFEPLKGFTLESKKFIVQSLIGNYQC